MEIQHFHMIQKQDIRQPGIPVKAFFRLNAHGFAASLFTAFLIASSFNTASCALAAAAPPVITSLAAIHALSNNQAAGSIPVAFEATVTYHIKGSTGVFLQDGGLAIYADGPSTATLTPGDRVLVRGTTRASFRPEIAADSFTVVGQGAIPTPVPASYMQLVRGGFDCVRVKVRGTVKSADLVTYGKVANIYLQLSMDSGSIDAIIDSSDGQMLEKLRGAQVELAGSTSGEFDSKDQLTGIVLKVPAFSDVSIIKEAAIGPDAFPLIPMDKILEHSFQQDLSEQVRVEGTITYYLPGTAAVLQNGAKSLWIETRDEQPLAIGDRATAFGYPAVRNGILTLTAAEIEDSHQQIPVAPEIISWDQLDSGANAFNLISIDGQVVKEGREEYQDEYVLTAGGHLFSVVYRHIDYDLGFELPPMKQVPVGATVRVTGITSVTYGSNPFEGPAGFDVLLRSFDDIKVVAGPSWMNEHNLTRLVGVLLAIIIVIGIRQMWTERRARRHTATMAFIERSRGQILIDINNSRPLAETLEEIAALVTTSLSGARCWIEVDDGATLGKALPAESLTGLRVATDAIAGRSGAHLGTIHAVFEGQSKPAAEESEALSQAAGLAALAIETSRLFADLVHRSEFDQLTEIHNRFSFEKRLEQAIEAARKSAAIFGLLFIDLDDFKRVNDRYGHQNGDIYLQQVAVRMKHILRPADILARLGGDEFAVMLPRVHGRADVQEVSNRLQRCFDQPFILEDCGEVRGAASIGIALYPADGADRDSLLATADTAMYAAKEAKRSVFPD
jgi:diguanylate cyclase (GGDEF)-like protein